MRLSRQMLRSGLLMSLVLLLASQGVAQQSQPEDIEATRLELLKKWGAGGLVTPNDIDPEAKALFALPLAEQPDDKLLALAKRANTAANLVGYILEEYQDYYQDNYRYDFVQTKVAPFHDAYVELSNRLMSYRNQAYFNLGKKAVARGDGMTAFFMFRDAYRLSSFADEEGDHKGMRYQAEQEMKKLLGIEAVGSFVYWR